MKSNIFAIDPGKKKCGYAIYYKKKIVEKGIIKDFFNIEIYKEKFSKYNIEKVVIGNSTNSKDIKEFLIKNSLIKNINIEFIDEKNSTLEAKYLFLKDNKKWYHRFIPLSLLYTNKDIDDYAAIVILERYFKNSNEK